MQFRTLGQQNGSDQDHSKKNFLCISDLNGDFAALEKLISDFEPSAIIHTGNFGFLDDNSISSYSHNHLIDIIEVNALLTKERKNSLLSIPEELLREELVASELSGFQKYLSGETKFSIPIYTTHGFFDDVSILNKMLDKQVHNLHFIYPGHSQVLDYGNIPIRLFGLGGNLIRNKLFDHGTISSILSGSREGSWITLVQLGAIYEDAQANETPGEIRILLTVSSPINDTLVSQLASCIKADFTFSSNIKTRYHSTFSIGSVYPTLSIYRDQMIQSRQQFKKIYEIVQNHYEKQLNASQKQAVKLALRLLDCLPPEETSGLLSEQGYFTDCQHLVLSRFQFGYALLVATQTQIAFKLQSEGVNFNHREKSFDHDRYDNIRDSKDKQSEKGPKCIPKDKEEKSSANSESKSDKPSKKPSKKNVRSSQILSSERELNKSDVSSVVEFSNDSRLQDSSRHPETPDSNVHHDEDLNEEGYTHNKTLSSIDENKNLPTAEPDCSSNGDTTPAITLEKSQAPAENQPVQYIEPNTTQGDKTVYPSQSIKNTPGNLPEQEIHFDSETKTYSPEFEKNSDQEARLEAGSHASTTNNSSDHFNLNNDSQLRTTSENSLQSLDCDFGLSRTQQRESFSNKGYHEYINHRGVQIVQLSRVDSKPDIWKQVADKLVYVQLRCEFQPNEDFDIVFEGLQEEIIRVFVYPETCTYIDVEIKDANQREIFSSKLRGRRFFDNYIQANPKKFYSDSRNYQRNNSHKNSYQSHPRGGGGFRDSSRKAAFGYTNSQSNHSDRYPKRDFYQGN